MDRINSNKAFRKDIEGVRAIAILLVLFYHANLPLFSGGYIGVDAFFVLSGYLITSVLIAEKIQTGRIRVFEFYSRRLLRLLPAMSVVIVFTTVVGYFLYSPVEQTHLAHTAFATAAYVSNLFFANLRTDYLGPGTETNPLLHTWSLSVEEQFYLFYPISILLLYLIFQFKGKSVESRALLSAFLALVLFASLVMSIIITELRQPLAFFLMPTRAWQFALGGLGFLIPAIIAEENGNYTVLRRVFSILFKRKSLVLLGWIGFVGLIATAHKFNKTTNFPGIAAFLPSFATILILCTAQQKDIFSIGRFLSIRPMQELGRLSYSLYLWHWVLLVFFNSFYSARYPVLFNCCVILISIGVSEISYRFIENPLRHNLFLKRRPRNALIFGGFLTSFCLILSGCWAINSNYELRKPEQLSVLNATNDIPKLYALDCHDDFYAIIPKGCAFGRDGAKIRIVLFGDSHAAQWFPALDLIAKRNNWSLKVFTKSACAPIYKVNFNDSIGREYSECQTWLNNVTNDIRRFQPQIIITSTYTQYDYSRNDWLQGMDNAMTRLTKIAGNVIVIRDTPKPGFNVPICLSRQKWYQRNFRLMVPCEFDRTNPHDDEVFKLQQSVVRNFKNVFLFDINDTICRESPCGPERNGLLIYRDDNHLTASFVESISDVLESKITAATGSPQVGSVDGH